LEELSITGDSTPITIDVSHSISISDRFPLLRVFELFSHGSPEPATSAPVEVVKLFAGLPQCPMLQSLSVWCPTLLLHCLRVGEVLRCEHALPWLSIKLKVMGAIKLKVTDDQDIDDQPASKDECVEGVNTTLAAVAELTELLNLKLDFSREVASFPSPSASPARPSASVPLVPPPLPPVPPPLPPAPPPLSRSSLHLSRSSLHLSRSSLRLSRLPIHLSCSSLRLSRLPIHLSRSSLRLSRPPPPLPPAPASPARPSAGCAGCALSHSFFKFPCFHTRFLSFPVLA
jgi:hypothetical protein